MAEQFLRIGGTDGENARGLRTDQQGNLSVTGSSSEIIIFDELEIRDTSHHRGDAPIAMDEYDIIILNGTDASFTLSINSYTDYFRLKSTRVFNGEKFNINRYDILRTTTLQYLPFDQIKIRGKISLSVVADVAPTSGSISIIAVKR